MISYLWVSHSLYLLIALGLCHHCHYFMPFCFPYTFDCFWRIFKFSLHQDSGWVATTYPKLSLNTHILSFCRWLFSLARLQVVASKLLEILLVFSGVTFSISDCWKCEYTYPNVSIYEFGHTSHLHPPPEAHVPQVWPCLHDYDALGLIL